MYQNTPWEPLFQRTNERTNYFRCLTSCQLISPSMSDFLLSSSNSCILLINPKCVQVRKACKGCRPQGQVQLEELHKLKNPMVLLGIEPATFLSACSRLVPQPNMLQCARVNIPLKEGIGQFVMVFLTDSRLIQTPGHAYSSERLVSNKHWVNTTYSKIFPH
jgi:hypothetical protein